MCREGVVGGRASWHLPTKGIRFLQLQNSPFFRCADEWVRVMARILRTVPVEGRLSASEIDFRAEPLSGLVSLLDRRATVRAALWRGVRVKGGGVRRWVVGSHQCCAGSFPPSQVPRLSNTKSVFTGRVKSPRDGRWDLFSVSTSPPPSRYVAVVSHPCARRLLRIAEIEASPFLCLFRSACAPDTDPHLPPSCSPLEPHLRCCCQDRAPEHEPQPHFRVREFALDDPATADNIEAALAANSGAAGGAGAGKPKKV